MSNSKKWWHRITPYSRISPLASPSVAKLQFGGVKSGDNPALAKSVGPVRFAHLSQ
ncbi:hypothetical protein [Paenibacillus uliginis]|uniref:hypothetical protein n=1 Tax=Paenibacillus uliginis TaxID=683737 RepID=UPI001AED0F2D|nr:hypothetical protein [Paenibacillus uliginis]